ncbi:3-dehydroquinate synthase [Haloferula sp. A504]|uniref:3-dehydroquinate synthase n=1 Tax=Haloferula sp. A504 TaxID=3373601 RepID=UPI0031C91576|nr:3-dehydroquinate synthase [Verrucomicrobiaceae bacterium E54]
MSRHDFQIPVSFKHRVCFTRDAFAPGNRLVAELLEEGGGRKVLVLVEDAVAAAWPELKRRVGEYFADLGFNWRGLRVLPGGEEVKVDDVLVREVWQTIDHERIDRHSYVLAIGGGAFLDAVGYAVATAHRGVRLVRFPTTTLAQDDSGVGVKCAINAFGKKNWVGSFAVPFAVVNDFQFLESQDEDVRRIGLIEAVKVSLVKDAEFFQWIRRHIEALAALERAPFEECVERSALAHARHIAEGGDPFETGSSRPLDFGHWAAHKLEQLSDFTLGHACAVSIGVALDTLYSARCGLLRECDAERVMDVLDTLRVPIWHDALDLRDAKGRRRVHEGLEEFREHLGGELTVLLLRDLGRGQDVHALDEGLVDACIDDLKRRAAALGAEYSPPRVS